MRKFSKNEKKYIVELVRLKQSTNSLSNKISFKYPMHFLYREFRKEKILFDARDENKPCIYFYRNENNIIHSEPSELCNKFMEFVILIQTLNDNGLIYLLESGNKMLTFPNLDNEQNKSFFEGLCLEGLAPNQSYQVDKSIAELLIKCINGSVFVSQSLVDLVKNNFFSVEEKTLKWTKIAAWAAVIGALFAFFEIDFDKIKVFLGIQ